MKNLKPTAKEALAELTGLHRDNVLDATGPLVPDSQMLALLVQTLFWASLESEEGQLSLPSVLWAQPHECQLSIRLQRPLPFSATEVVKLSPVCGGPNALGVHALDGGTPRIWGLVQQADGGVRVRAHAAGLISASYRYIRLLVCARETCHFVGAGLPQGARMLTKGLESTLDETRRLVLGIVLLQVMARVSSLGRGGTLLVVPHDGNRWRELVEAERYPVAGIADLIASHFERLLGQVHDTMKATGMDAWHVLHLVPDLNHFLMGEPFLVGPELRAAADAIARLAAVDGAVVLDDRLNVLSFGVRIGASDRAPTAYWETAPIRHGGTPIRRRAAVMIGGTRHQAALRFVAGDHDCIAVVVSHDGNVSSFQWATDMNDVGVLRHLEYLF